MAGDKQTTNFAEIAYGFISRMSMMNPVFRGYSEFMGQNPPPSALIILKNPDKKIFVNPGEEPMVSEVSDGAPDANFILTVDAEIFHYIVWGRVIFAKALNEKLFMMESNRSVPPEDQPGTGMPGGPILFNNYLYEMYLIRIGAGHLIKENPNPTISELQSPRQVKEIQLEPVPGKTMLGAMANASGRVLGWMAGPILRLALKLRKVEDLEAPLEFSEVPDPRPKNPAASSGVMLAVMKALFKRIDMFSVMENMVKGMMATNPFKK